MTTNDRWQTTDGWHVSEESLSAWLSRTGTPLQADSVEQHLIACAQCRERTTAKPVDVLGLDLGEVWIGIADRIEPQRRTWPARMAARIGIGDADVTLLSAAPAFRLAWITGLAIVLALTLLASGWHPVRALHLYLLVAPLVPVLGVTASYGQQADPTLELVVASPYSNMRLLLLRSVAVLVACAPLTMVTGLLLQPWWVGLAWLMPALAFVLITLAFSTWQTPERAAAVVAVIWIGISVLALTTGDPLALVGPVAMGTFTTVIVGCTALFVRRRDQFAASGFLA